MIITQPYPIVRWYDKHDQDLCKQNNKRYKTCSNGTRRSLVINSVELSDAGVIKCLGINKEGQVECSTLLLVEGEKYCFFYNEEKLECKFLQLISSSTD